MFTIEWVAVIYFLIGFSSGLWYVYRAHVVEYSVDYDECTAVTIAVLLGWPGFCIVYILKAPYKIAASYGEKVRRARRGY